MRKKHIYLIIALALMGLIVTEVRADTVTFDSWKMISGDEGTPVTNQLSVTVAGVGETFYGYTLEADEVLFIFSNTGPTISSIADLYFDDGDLITLTQIFNDGTALTSPATPGNLPGGNNIDPDFVTTDQFSAGGEFQDGVQPGETVGILFDISGDFDSIIAAIYEGFALQAGDDPTGTLRIGVHVQGIGGDEEGYSQEYLLTPVPGAAILGILGLGIVGIKLRKFA